MPLFGPTRSERDHNELIEVQKQVRELQRELDDAQRRIDAVDLHARAIVEEAKRLINKFERRLDRESPPSTAAESHQDAPGRTNGGGGAIRTPQALPMRRNY